jgi:hypothetical protein
MSIEHFSDLTITTLNEQESFKRSGQLWEKVYNFSAPPPDEWGRLFADVWAGASYVPKRHARVENGLLVTICLASEVHPSHQHMQFLHAAVERTNAAYRQFLAGPAAE